jgi:hypothetical protein
MHCVYILSKKKDHTTDPCVGWFVLVGLCWFVFALLNHCHFELFVRLVANWSEYRG